MFDPVNRDEFAGFVLTYVGAFAILDVLTGCITGKPFFGLF